MEDRRTHLKIKIKTLAAESKIIRLEEKKAEEGYERNILTHHRREIVRKVTRVNILAYLMIKGIPYHDAEIGCRTPPKFEEVIKVAKKFGLKDTEKMDKWLTDAVEHLKTFCGIKISKPDLEEKKESAISLRNRLQNVFRP